MREPADRREPADFSINLAAWCKNGTEVLGPGKRLAIWTQGCMKHCPGCISPEFRECKEAQLVDGKALAAYAICHRELSGITISGGEPFLQASALAKLIRAIRKERDDFSSIVFTGFCREELVWEEAAALLSVTDLLIDGPYVQEQFAGEGLRGSSNQRFHFLTDKLKPYSQEILSGKRSREIHCDEKSLFPIGIPSEEGAFGNIFKQI